ATDPDPLALQVLGLIDAAVSPAEDVFVHGLALGEYGEGRHLPAGLDSSEPVADVQIDQPEVAAHDRTVGRDHRAIGDRARWLQLHAVDRHPTLDERSCDVVAHDGNRDFDLVSHLASPVWARISLRR